MNQNESPESSQAEIRLAYLRNRPVQTLNDRVPCRGKLCRKSFPYQALKHEGDVYLIDGVVYCPPCAAKVAGGMLAACLAGGYKSRAEYYQSVVGKLEEAYKREQARLNQTFDEEVDLEDSAKMTKLLKDPGGAMQTKSLEGTLKDSIRKNDERLDKPKIQVGHGN